LHSDEQIVAVETLLEMACKAQTNGRPSKKSEISLGNEDAGNDYEKWTQILGMTIS